MQTLYEQYDDLTKEQIECAIGLMLSDAWVKGDWMCLRQSYKNTALLEQTEDVFSGSGLVKDRKPHISSKTNSLDSYEIRIGPHPLFGHLGKLFYPSGTLRSGGKTFYPKGVKIMPAVSWLNKYMTDLTLAFWIMGDGSRKSSKNKSMEIHTQGFTINSASRGAVSIYETTGIICKVSIEKNRNNSPVIYICGENIDILIERIKPLMHRDLNYKVPEPRKNKPPKNKKPSACEIWYLEVRDSNWREDIEPCIAAVKQKLADKPESPLKKK
jgi:hypothetical protein